MKVGKFSLKLAWSVRPLLSDSSLPYTGLRLRRAIRLKLPGGTCLGHFICRHKQHVI
jgi:hypothetical protein